MASIEEIFFSYQKLFKPGKAWFGYSFKKLNSASDFVFSKILNILAFQF
jgi:hypothetical protein